MKAQINKCIQVGIKPVFINSHQHLHLLPNIMDMTIKLAKEFDIPYIRVVVEPISLGKGKLFRQAQLLFLNFYHGCKKKIKRPVFNIMIFMGFIDAGNLNIKSLKLVEKLQKRIQKNHRIGVSPDLKIKLVEKYKHWHYHWAKEIEVLKTKMMSRKILIFTLVASVFLIARLPAVHQIYHQDEYKWAMQADPIDNESPHLPFR